MSASDLPGRALGLYIHIPFCRSKCAYCDFVSRSGGANERSRYVRSVLAEMERAADGSALRSVFIGGGTPSLLAAEEIAALMAGVRGGWRLDVDAEVTMEGNPGTFAPEQLAAVRRAGVNRLSIGAQAAQPELLHMLGRIHDWAHVEQTVRDARAAGFGNINLDLMYALPGQSLADWERTLEGALALEVPHISAYALTLEPGTPLHARVDAGELVLPGEETELAQAQTTRDRLRRAGLARYEISNYARPGYECRHNGMYWDNGDYVGLGCAAHGHHNGERVVNEPDVARYIHRVESGHSPVVDRTPDEPGGSRVETMMLGLRRIAGIDEAQFARRYGAPPERWFAKGIRELMARGLMERCDGHFYLTERGLDVQNAALVLLWETMESDWPILA